MSHVGALDVTAATMETRDVAHALSVVLVVSAVNARVRTTLTVPASIAAGTSWGICEDVTEATPIAARITGAVRLGAIVTYNTTTVQIIK